MTLVGIEAIHPWLDSNMTVVGYGPISSQSEFLKSRLLLSQVVNAVVQQFQLNPPTNLRITDPSLQRMQPSQRSSTVVSAGRNSVQSSTPTYSQPTRKRDVSEIHFSEVIDLDSNDKQKISRMMSNYVSSYSLSEKKSFLLTVWNWNLFPHAHLLYY